MTVATRDELAELLVATKLRHDGLTRVSSAQHGEAMDLANAQLAALTTAGLAIVDARLLVGHGMIREVCPKCKQVTEEPLQNFAAGRLDQ